MNHAEAVQFIYDLNLFGAKFGLDNTFRLTAPHSGMTVAGWEAGERLARARSLDSMG
jgi:hypothetical protein